MRNKKSNMRKMLIILSLAILLVGCVNAQNNTIEINEIEFELPDRYLGGELKNDRYALDNVFSIECIDNNVGNEIGLWACEKDFEENIMIEGHPVRHYSQYNQYVHANQSHAYFASGDSVYEITWTGEDIDSEIKDLIKNTPKSNISKDEFYNMLDESIDIYKSTRIDQLNSDAEYNYLESRLNSLYSQDAGDDSNLNQILLTFYR